MNAARAAAETTDVCRGCGSGAANLFFSDRWIGPPCLWNVFRFYKIVGFVVLCTIIVLTRSLSWCRNQPIAPVARTATPPRLFRTARPLVFRRDSLLPRSPSPAANRYAATRVTSAVSLVCCGPCSPWPRPKWTSSAVASFVVGLVHHGPPWSDPPPPWPRSLCASSAAASSPTGLVRREPPRQ